MQSTAKHRKPRRTNVFGRFDMQRHQQCLFPTKDEQLVRAPFAALSISTFFEAGAWDETSHHIR